MAKALKSGKSKSSAATNPKSTVDNAVKRMAEILLKQMEGMSASDWKKPWITGFGGLPQNIRGTSYSGMNDFLLQLHSMQNGYSVPVYMTFLQMKDECEHMPEDKKIMINKGEKSLPVLYWNFMYKDKDGKKVKKVDYEKMTREEKKGIERIPFLKNYPVFNIDQTNMKEVMPERYEQLQNRFKKPELRDAEGMYSCPEIDAIFKNQSWHCPIRYEQPSDRAYFSINELLGNSYIVLPQKEQFNKGGSEEEIYAHGMRYYATALHEMGHSTCQPLDIDISGGIFGNKEYALEELRADMTAATLGSILGFDVSLRENHAAYVKNWMTALKEEPVKVLTSVLPKVSRTVDYMLLKIDEQRLILGKEPLRNKLDANEREEERVKEEKTETKATVSNMTDFSFPSVTLQDGTVIDEVQLNKLKDQTWGVSLVRDNQTVGPIRISPKDFESFGMKQTTLPDLVERYFPHDTLEEPQARTQARTV